MKNTSIASCLSDCIELICQRYDSDYVPIIGVSGPQGSGKTTALTALHAEKRKRIAALGLDDFYLSKTQRVELAKVIDPLFKTRGPAGTHCLTSIVETLKQLRNAGQGSVTPLIKFSKLEDDRLPQSNWASFIGRPDVILFEGWLVGAVAPPDFDTSDAINEVEMLDEKCRWRRYQKLQLDTEYADLWNKFDAFIHIQGPSFDAVYEWRMQQESETLNVPERELTEDRCAWIRDFIQYFQRLTIAMSQGSRRQGAIVSIDSDRQVIDFDTSGL